MDAPQQVVYVIRAHAKLADADADGREHIDPLYWRDGGWTRDPERASHFETLQLAGNRVATEPELSNGADVIGFLFPG